MIDMFLRNDQSEERAMGMTKTRWNHGRRVIELINYKDLQ